MTDGLTSHHCDAPSCPYNAKLRFLGITPLCVEHGIAANRRAMVNTAIVGPVLALCGVILMLTSAAVAALKPIGVGLAIVGCLVLLLAPWFARAARKLEAE